MSDPRAQLEALLTLGKETEWVERKTVKGENYCFDELGQYFSALSNEALLHDKKSGWLIMGVNNQGRIIGTNYKRTPGQLDGLKHEITKHLSNHLSFVAVHEFEIDSKRVLLFEIPAALKGIPTAWKGHFYGRDGESLVALNLEEIERIRAVPAEDWSAGICSASVVDLSPEAIQKARGEYANKNPRLSEEIARWDDLTFLNKALLAIDGKVTRAAIILLGKPESEALLSPAVATISWILKDAKNQELDYEHFGPPWLLNVSAVYRKVRNLRYRHLPDGTLFPIEVNQYDDWVFREALHNCIAHQDYSLRSRIMVVEFPDRILFQNAGSFLPESIERVIQTNAPSPFYRNQFLARAMVNLGMIDTIGSGIKRMFVKQRERLFPLPDYQLEQNSVGVNIHGRTIDPNYVQLLTNHLDLDLFDLILLDKIQKKIKIPYGGFRRLKKLGLAEGRYPSINISSMVAAVTSQKAKYLRNRGLEERHYAEMILEHIHQFGSITRKEADDLISPMLPSILDEKQKKAKIHRLLSIVLKEKIQNSGNKKNPRYVLRD
uniref:Transcriptional regulator n=1 Tax=Anaerolinea thermolimosa TaxID=229919 RepID=A0A7C4PP55_9CHLR